MTNQQIFKRSEYMAGKCSHDEYYSQFLTQRTLDLVGLKLNKQKLAGFEWPFNNFSLQFWDAIDTKYTIKRQLWVECNDTFGANPSGRFHWSAADNVCIAKQAARLIKEGATL